MHALIPEVERVIAERLARHEYNEALAEIVVGVRNSYKSAELAHSHLCYPGLDRFLLAMADQLSRSAELAETTVRRRVDDGETEVDLVLATELHPIGGHSAVAHDLVEQLERPRLIMTDLFWLYRRVPTYAHWAETTYARAKPEVLQATNLWEKCLELAVLLARLRPRRIWHLTHHEDPLGWVGSLVPRRCPHILLHHADHNPSLGTTLPSQLHVDFTPEIAAICQRTIGAPTRLFPLHVRDQGLKPLLQPALFDSVATAGNQLKYALDGPTSLPSIVRTVLACSRGRFFHIGPLDETFVRAVADALTEAGLSTERFVHLGQVASVWQTLLQLPVGLYLGSAPTGGGLSAIEAQGAGLPSIFYRGHPDGSALAVSSPYASPELGWQHLEELPLLLDKLRADPFPYSRAAREHYLAHHSLQSLRRAISGIQADTPSFDV